ncbi:putative uncharacterized protein CXorf58 homolog isoform X2 [Electrophorus electricus]|uniref:putative uncharacterized protein CXorf58 homolog isoform X2 n=1 Tax=Electrophorus electricus TaxID=8005 RepID=UPI0015D04E15|nr:putative uncharacterized protein CXorf58 homolog isoform X2 [Electrophorus electricus]
MMEYGLNRQMRENSARKIQAYWRSYQDRRLFRLLLNTEQCLTPAVLRQLSPREAHLLRDPSLPCKVRFRFSGSQFPPVIVFKIFHLGQGMHYLSGKKLFRPSNQATADTFQIMGKRKFVELMTKDEIQWRDQAISDPADITCMRDYMQYSSHLDELPIHLGGRGNTWRHLSLKALSRNCPSTDGVADQRISSVLRSLQNEAISGPKAGGQLALPLRSPAARLSSRVSSLAPQTCTRHSARVQHIRRMRRLYTPGEHERVLAKEQQKKGTLRTDRNDNYLVTQNKADEKCILSDTPLPLASDEVTSGTLRASDSEWEEEAEKLCYWSNQLALDGMEQEDDL